MKIRLGVKQSWGALPYGKIVNRLNIKPTLGVGMPIQIWQRQYILLDYAIDPGTVGEGISHLFTFTVDFKK